MPKQTFLNLTDKKRDQLVATALKEFAERDYNSASVSKIVERAGIAKGSFYQYFKNKQDLFIYLVEVASQKMLEFIAQTPPPDPDADFFDTLRWQMAASVKAAVKYPIHSKLVRRAYSSPLPFRDRLLENAKRIRNEHFGEMVAKAQATGQLDASLDPEVIGLVIQGLMNDLGQFLESKLGKRGTDWIEDPEVERIFDQVVKVLKDGLKH